MIRARLYLPILWLALAGFVFTSNKSIGQEPSASVPLTGTVFDSDGKPIADANIFVIRQTFGPFRQTAHRAIAGKGGKFAIRDFASKNERVNIRATVCEDGYVMSWLFLKLAAGDEIRPLEFKIQPARDITFRVVDSAGKALSGVQVIPRQRDAPDGTSHIIFSQSAKAISKTTDIEGRVKFTLFNTGDLVTLGTVDGSRSQVRPVKIEKEAATIDVTFAARGETVRSRVSMPDAREPDPRHVKWVADNVVRFDSIDPNNESFDDLKPLQEIIGDARVVMLGEQSHGDGACFETKIRLIKYLHQEMGFDVLMFESGLFDCHVAWQDFVAGKPPQEAARQGVFGIWTASRQVQPLFDYLGKQANTKNALELAGFDCQFTAAGSKRLSAAIKKFATKLAADSIDAARIDTACDSLEDLIASKRPEGELDQFQKTMDQLSVAALKLARKQSPDNRDTLFWSQVFLSSKTQAAMKWSGRTTRSDVNTRDRQMGENLIWLARTYYAKRKIIVWAASFHNARNVNTITTLNPGLTYEKTTTMGHVVHEALGAEMYSVAFTAGSGKFGNPFSRPNDLSAAPAGTLEDLFARARVDNGLINFRSEGAKMITPIYSRPLGHQYMQADWSGVFDAMIFNKTMTASTR